MTHQDQDQGSFTLLEPRKIENSDYFFHKQFKRIVPGNQEDTLASKIKETDKVGSAYLFSCSSFAFYSVLFRSTILSSIVF